MANISIGTYGDELDVQEDLARRAGSEMAQI